MSIWMNGKKFMKDHCLKNRNPKATELCKILQTQITCMQKEFVKTVK